MRILYPSPRCLFLGAALLAGCEAVPVDLVDPVDFSVQKVGTGTGTVRGGDFDCDADCTGQLEQVLPGFAFDLVAEAAPGSAFVGWEGGGCDNGTDAETTARPSSTTSAENTCVARFDLLPVGGDRLTRLSVLQLPSRGEALAYSGDLAYLGDFEDVSFLRTIDFSNPASPSALGTLGCGYRLRNLAVIRDLSRAFDELVASSVEGGGCRAPLPLGSGSTLLLPGGGRGELKQVSPDLVAQALFTQGVLRISSVSPTGTFLQDVPLGTGRSCPFSLDGNGDRIVVVGREGEAGTATENCNNERKAWVVDRSGGSWSLTATYDLGGKPRGVVLSPDGNVAWVANYELDQVDRIDIENDVRSRFVIESPTGIARDNGAEFLAVTLFDQNTVGVYDADNGSLLGEAGTGGGQPASVLFSDRGTFGVLGVRNFQDPGRTGGSMAFLRFNYSP
jgi:hypothetical protein